MKSIVQSVMFILGNLTKLLNDLDNRDESFLFYIPDAKNNQTDSNNICAVHRGCEYVYPLKLKRTYT